MTILGFIGTTEIVVILIIALLVFGPQKLPEVGQQIGSLYKELNRMRGDVTRALDIDEYTRYDARDHDTNPYSNGYTYDTPADHAADGVQTVLHHKSDTPMIAGSDMGNIAPPGPLGTVASHSPFTAPSAEADFDTNTGQVGVPPFNTAAQIYKQPGTQEDASPAPPYKEQN